MSDKEVEEMEVKGKVEEEIGATEEKKRKFILDLWKTRLHGVTTGIKQQEEHMAKSRQFNRDMKLFGEVKEVKNGNEVEIGYVGYREGLWDEQDNKLERRLVIKLFSKSIYYQGTIEEMLGKEYTRSLSAQKDFPSFNVLIDGYEYVIYLDKIRGGWFLPEWFVFRLDTENGFIPIILKHKMGPGIDYRVVNGIGNDQIGLINGHKFDIGGKFVINLKSDDKNLTSKEMVRTLILFAASLKFHKDIYKKIKKGSDLMRKGKFSPTLSNEELLLSRNPRAMLRK